MGSAGKAGVRVYNSPPLLSWLASFWDWVRPGEHDGRLWTRDFSPLDWHCHKMASCVPGRCWKFPLCLLGTFVGSSAASLLGSLAAAPMTQAVLCFQSAAGSSAPQQAPGFLVAKSLQTLAAGVQVLFPDVPLGRTYDGSRQALSLMWCTSGSWEKVSHQSSLCLLAWCE